jgi:hypothetical protein
MSGLSFTVFWHLRDLVDIHAGCHEVWGRFCPLAPPSIRIVKRFLHIYMTDCYNWEKESVQALLWGYRPTFLFGLRGEPWKHSILADVLTENLTWNQPVTRQEGLPNTEARITIRYFAFDFQAHHIVVVLTWANDAHGKFKTAELFLLISYSKSFNYFPAFNTCTGGESPFRY